ncbi:MAG TPA: hypothetical protein VG458_00340 [Solirubrobacterales bacterium]|nr:hypothetical protein [Solirubrobacterales bacterium]
MLSFVDAATGSVSRVLAAAADSFELGSLGEGSAATPSGSRSPEADPPAPAPPLPGWIDQDPALSAPLFYLVVAAGLVLVSVVLRRELGPQHPYRRRTRPQR